MTIVSSALVVGVKRKSLSVSPVSKSLSMMHYRAVHSKGDKTAPIVVFALVHQKSSSSSSAYGVSQSDVLSGC